MLEEGGLDWCVKRSTLSSEQKPYGWVERSGYTTPFIANSAKRSLVAATITSPRCRRRALRAEESETIWPVA